MRTKFTFIAWLLLAAARAEDPIAAASGAKPAPLPPLEILNIRDGSDLHPALAMEEERVHGIERRCLAILKEGTPFQKRNAIEIIRIYNLRKLAPVLIWMIDFREGMIYPSGNPADPSKSAESVYPCYAVLKEWRDAGLETALREELGRTDAEQGKKRDLLKLLQEPQPK